MAIKQVKLPNNSVVEIQDSRITGVDTTPTAGSGNVVTSGGVYNAISAAQQNYYTKEEIDRLLNGIFRVKTTQ